MEKMTPDGLTLTPAPNGTLAVPVGRSPATLPVQLTGAQNRRAILTRTVQLHVIPKLLARPAHRGAGSIHAHVERLAGLSLQASGNEVVDFVAGLLETGFDAETLYLELLAPTAQLLGQYWADDHCTFADVTIGVGHLQAAMRALRPAFFKEARAIAADAPRALLLPLPGEQHVFGVRMLAAFFTRAGWDAWCGCLDTATELADMVRRDWIDVVGFSVSHDAMLETTQREIAAVRDASRNTGLIVMVGGLVFAQNPALAEQVGADGTALDGAQAVEVATGLLPIRLTPP